ncbi:MAG: NADH:flavin oxidoreductase [Deltaproteobacteria bacterium SG8_13]|nr:MAG: NADH:flavin oxidoreductase [Deltaproteobacteria bacterium SG8_13]
MFQRLFSEIAVGGLILKNRLTMAPTYLGYAGEGGRVSAALLDHYRLMARSGVSMVVVENSTIDFQTASGSRRTIRVDSDDHLEGLQRLAGAIKDEGALACLQINHAGRFAFATEEPVAPSAVETFGRTPRALAKGEIERIVGQFAGAALRVRQAGFDAVELHGGTGYLLTQFLSPRTNKRTDEYGGEFARRQRFPLEVVAAVKAAVGDFPVGYRFLADEWLPDGLQLKESTTFAAVLAKAGVAYISVMGGTYESFSLPEITQKSKQPAYMLDLAAAVKKAVDVPVISAGRLNTGETAEKAIADGKTDLIGLARVLWADPQWPQKVSSGRQEQIIHCDPECGDACMQMVMKGRPAFCVRWPSEKTKEWKAKFA